MPLLISMVDPNTDLQMSESGPAGYAELDTVVLEPESDACASAGRPRSSVGGCGVPAAPVLRSEGVRGVAGPGPRGSQNRRRSMEINANP